MVLEKGELLILILFAFFIFAVLAFFVANFSHHTSAKPVISFKTKANFTAPILAANEEPNGP